MRETTNLLKLFELKDLNGSLVFKFAALKSVGPKLRDEITMNFKIENQM